MDLTRGTGKAPPTDELASQQVCWSEVHVYVLPVLEEAESWPMAGTPAWCLLADDDPRKIAAIYDAGQHHTLRVESCQQTLADASRAISEAENWTCVGRRMIRRQQSVYIPRTVA